MKQLCIHIYAQEEKQEKKLSTVKDYGEGGKRKRLK